MKEPEMHLKFIKEIKGNKVYEVTRDDLTPDNVGMIVVHTSKGREYPFNSVEEVDNFFEKYTI